MVGDRRLLVYSLLVARSTAPVDSLLVYSLLLGSLLVGSLLVTRCLPPLARRSEEVGGFSIVS